MVLPLIPIIVSAVGWGLAVPSGLACVAGFGSSGIVGGSLAALFQSSVANVAAGSLFSLATSMGMKSYFTYAFFTGTGIIGGLLSLTGEDPIASKVKDTAEVVALSLKDTVTETPGYFTTLAHTITDKVKELVNVKGRFEWIKNKFSRSTEEPKKREETLGDNLIIDTFHSAASKSQSMFKSFANLFSYNNDDSVKADEEGWYHSLKRKIFGEEEKPKNWFEKIYKSTTGNVANAFDFIKGWTTGLMFTEKAAVPSSSWYGWIKSKVSGTAVEEEKSPNFLIRTYRSVFN